MSAGPRETTGKNQVCDSKQDAYSGVWVVVEHDRGRAHPVSWELLGAGRELAASLGVDLAAIVLGAPGQPALPLCAEGFEYGADLCYLVQNEVLRDYRNSPYAQALYELVTTYRPEIVLLGATTVGRDLAGSVATRLETGLTADCTGLAIDKSNRGLLATRPTFGGSLLCTIVTRNCRPQMATVRPRVMPIPAKDVGRQGKIVRYPLTLRETDVVTKMLAFIPDNAADRPQLPFADIVVAGGRGMKTRENFQLLWDLARVLHAEVGASRPAVQAGWVDADRQVGQSGKTVRPQLYIAAGISGAIQHRVGMEGADCIVAVNNDPDAPIFEFAHYGIVGDALEILPALTRALKRRTVVEMAEQS